MCDVLGSGERRFRFIDGLRGLAAVAVMIHHAFGSARLGFSPGLHDAVWFGRRGVQVFFVISGFVIAHSMAGVRVTLRAAGNFIARRHVRLDAVFWVCLGLAYVRLRGMSLAKPFEHAMPSVWDLVVNAAYVSSVVGRNRLLGVTWTLSLEVQFYAVFVAIAWLDSAWGAARERHGTRAVGVAAPVALALGLVSVWYRQHVMEDMDAWWFTQGWNLFALGVLAYWGYAGRCSVGWFLCLWSAVLAAGLEHRQEGMLVGAAAAMMVFGVAMTGRMQTWLTQRPVQFLGTISYSLYLLHNEVICRVQAMADAMGWSGTAALTAWWTLAGCLTSVGLAYVLHLTVERPTRALAARLKPAAGEARGDAEDELEVAVEPGIGAALVGA